MTTKPSLKNRQTTGAPGINGLITAVAVAATLGGWAVLSFTPSDAASVNAPVVVAPAQPAVVQPNPPQLRRVAPPPVAITRSSR